MISDPEAKKGSGCMLDWATEIRHSPHDDVPILKLRSVTASGGPFIDT